MCGLTSGNKFLGATPGARSAKGKIDELVFAETARLCSSKEDEKMLEKIPAGHRSHQRLESGASEALTTQKEDDKQLDRPLSQDPDGPVLPGDSARGQSARTGA